ncbi:hypothetical protein HUJ05_013152 [Dendroctonus ponderosae]|nr:hypothetical protein HUJ05_013152 [Dendroctonus ponderosae]
MYKSSGKPALVIKEPQYELKTPSQEIKEQIMKAEEKETVVPQASLSQKVENSTREPRREIIDEEASIVPLICPHKDASKPLFSLPCFSNNNCGFLGKDMLCCDGRCLKGIKKPKGDPHHDPIFFGIIERKCPDYPLTELSEVKECITDDECSPRICCGETLRTGEKARYCRTPIPVWDTLPLPSPVLEPLKTITSYMQCTPPPPAQLDLYPKTCQNLMDCFPNLCCQEKGKKFCRPPKRSLLALVAELGQRIIPEDAARKFIERLS